MISVMMIHCGMQVLYNTLRYLTEEKVVSRPDAFELDHVLASFVVLITGIAVSVVVFLSEKNHCAVNANKNVGLYRYA